MKGWVFGPELRDDLPEPEGEIVAVKATSVNAIDNRATSGVLGHDFAGVTGGRLAGVRVRARRGVVGADRVRPVRRSETGVVVAGRGGAAGVAGTFALAYVESLGLRGGERMLVVGATGGAGAFAVQLCVALGCSVVAPALDIDEAYLRGLGVSEVVARDERPAADAVIDFVPPAAGVSAMADPSTVARLGALIDEHSLRVPICEGFSFGQVPEALAAFGDHKQGELSVV